MAQLFGDALQTSELVKKFGCVSYKQLERAVHFPKNNMASVINFLAYNKYINKISDKYIVNPGSEVDSTQIDCVWAVLDTLTHDGEIDFDTLLSADSFYGQKSKVRLSFVKDAEYIINICPISNQSIVDAVYLQQRFYETTGVKKGDEKNPKIIYYFVTRNKSIIKELDKLTIPHITVLLTYPKTVEKDENGNIITDFDIPEIEYIVPKS